MKRIEPAPAHTLLLFSGGRDSTLAAVRLARSAPGPLLLVTISSSHLIGIDRVKRRLQELSPALPPGTTWQCIAQPTLESTFSEAFGNTCLPCQRDYVAVGAHVARSRQIPRLALGYASYQSDWPEQHSTAIERLRGRLQAAGLELSIPVYNLTSRAEAEAELSSLGLSTDALEQKCLKQINNIRLSDEALVRHLDNWETRLNAALSQSPPPALKLLHEIELNAAPA